MHGGTLEEIAASVKLAVDGEVWERVERHVECIGHVDSQRLRDVFHAAKILSERVGSLVSTGDEDSLLETYKMTLKQTCNLIHCSGGGIMTEKEGRLCPRDIYGIAVSDGFRKRMFKPYKRSYLTTSSIALNAEQPVRTCIDPSEMTGLVDELRGRSPERGEELYQWMLGKDERFKTNVTAVYNEKGGEDPDFFERFPTVESFMRTEEQVQALGHDEASMEWTVSIPGITKDGIPVVVDAWGFTDEGGNPILNNQRPLPRDDAYYAQIFFDITSYHLPDMPFNEKLLYSRHLFQTLNVSPVEEGQLFHQPSETPSPALTEGFYSYFTGFMKAAEDHFDEALAGKDSCMVLIPTDSRNQVFFKRVRPGYTPSGHPILIKRLKRANAGVEHAVLQRIAEESTMRAPSVLPKSTEHYLFVEQLPASVSVHDFLMDMPSYLPREQVLRFRTSLLDHVLSDIAHIEGIDFPLDKRDPDYRMKIEESLSDMGTRYGVDYQPGDLNTIAEHIFSSVVEGRQARQQDRTPRNMRIDILGSLMEEPYKERFSREIEELEGLLERKGILMYVDLYPFVRRVLEQLDEREREGMVDAFGNNRYHLDFELMEYMTFASDNVMEASESPTFGLSPEERKQTHHRALLYHEGATRPEATHLLERGYRAVANEVGPEVYGNYFGHHTAKALYRNVRWMDHLGRWAETSTPEKRARHLEELRYHRDAILHMKLAGVERLLQRYVRSMTI